MKGIREALDAMMPAFRPVGVERVPLARASGRILAETLRARTDLPAFDNSAMDGYAVRAQDAPKGTELDVQGESRAGGPLPAPLTSGTAMRIFTGAPLPDGADAVIPQEDVTRSAGSDRIRVENGPAPNRHVRRRGSDLAAEAVMVEAGRALGAGEIGLLAGQGIGSVDVHRAPTVAILSTGDELRDLTDPDRPGSIINSNAYALAAQVREAGGIPWVLPNVPDDEEATVQALQHALRADVVLTSGGVSVGEHDVVKRAFERVGVEADFWKVRMKPGKPLTFGRRKETPVVGLPGNPVSAMVTFEIFVRPGIRAMQGDRTPFRWLHTLPLAAGHTRKPGRPELARARIEATPEGPAVRLHPQQGSGSLPSMVGVDALVLLDAKRDRFEAGERLPAVKLVDRSGSATPPFDG